MGLGFIRGCNIMYRSMMYRYLCNNRSSATTGVMMISLYKELYDI